MIAIPKRKVQFQVYEGLRRMKIDCPHGWKSVVKAGNITCEARFIIALRRSHTLEGCLEEHVEH